jgi:hypothetical protein
MQRSRSLHVKPYTESCFYRIVKLVQATAYKCDVIKLQKSAIQNNRIILADSANVPTAINMKRFGQFFPLNTQGTSQ